MLTLIAHWNLYLQDSLPLYQLQGAGHYGGLLALSPDVWAARRYPADHIWETEGTRWACDSSGSALLLTSSSLQGIMFRCSAVCCENPKASMQQVHQCIERCHTPLAQAQAIVTQELERFQVRTVRCRSVFALEPG